MTWWFEVWRTAPVVGIAVYVFWLLPPRLRRPISQCRKTLDAHIAESGRGSKVLVAHTAELRSRADRNTEALQAQVELVAQLAARVDRLERAGHRHPGIRSEHV